MEARTMRVKRLDMRQAGDAEIAAIIRGTQKRLPGFKKTGRNDPCPCGSGKKFKRCCLRLFVGG